VPEQVAWGYSGLLYGLFCVTWVLLPVAIDTLDSGGSSLRRRLGQALYRQAAMGLLCLLFLLAYVGYLVYFREMEMLSVLALLPRLGVFLSQAWLTFLVGYGMVGLPRTWLQNFQGHSCQHAVKTVTRRLEDARLDLELTKAKLQFLREDKQYESLLRQLVPIFKVRPDRYNLPE
jgi:hypothetical protein